MSVLTSWMLEYLVNSLWMVPLVFAAAWIAARLARLAGPRAEHRIWVSALLLQVVLPACRMQSSGVWNAVQRLLAWRFAGRSAAGVGHVAVSIGPGFVNGSLVMPSLWIVVLAVAYGCTTLYFAARLAWGMRSTYVIQRGARKASLSGTALRMWERCCAVFVLTDVDVAISSAIAGPVTVGLWRSMLLLPLHFAERIQDADLNAVMAHECAHMQRRDFAKNLLYRMVSLPVAYHPVLWLTLARVAESREVVCDAMAADLVAGGENYARSLLRLATIVTSGAPARTLHAIGIFDANTFERRVMRLTARRIEIGRRLRAVTVVACVAVGAATCASALALRMEIAAPGAAAAEQNEKTSTMKVSAGVMAGNVIYQKPPVYPSKAKAENDVLNGPVVLQAIINKEGLVEKLVVKQSLRADYDASALDAVREWRYKPYLLNGNPVEVETTITVNFSIQK